MRLSAYLLLLSLFVSVSVSAQTRWKRYRYEVVYGIGASNFLGELGGADQLGTDYFKDLELSLTRPALHAGMRYKVTQTTAVKVGFTFGMIAGDDSLTTNQNRNDRNLHFRSPIFEFATTYEFSFFKERIGHRYSLRGVRGIKRLELYPYGFVGIGAFFFNPKAKYQNQWYALQPIGTEGQGKIAGRDPYDRFQISIPVGLGFRYAIDRKWLVGVEFGVRKTFTDYMDDVSTTYVDPDLFPEGSFYAYLANPTVTADNPEGWSGATAGQQRGDRRDLDTYMFMVFSINYKLRTTRSGKPKW